MRAPEQLSRNDSRILEQLFDPEIIPDQSGGVMVDADLPADPNIGSSEVLTFLQQEEGKFIKTVERSLLELDSTAKAMDSLIEQYPRYASLRNNRAQLLRIRYSDFVLTDQTLQNVAATILNDLNTAIQLLSPSSPLAAISPQQRSTLMQAHMQRAALFHASAKLLKGHSTLKCMDTITWHGLQTWDAGSFEAASSKDFFMAGRYGNEIGKTLAVHNNPTAKLCGQIVQEAMKSEYGIAL